MINLQWHDQDPSSSFIGWRTSTGSFDRIDFKEASQQPQQTKKQQAKKSWWPAIILVILIILIIWFLLR